MEYISVIGGLILLVIAGDKLVEGSVAIAERLNVSKLVIGITVVSFGTSAPELVVGIDAALSEATELALGNVVGSNIANVLLVLGIPALCYPFVCDDSEIRYGLFFMMLATVLFIGLSFFGPLDIWQGTLMLSLLLIFLVYSVRRARNNSAVLKHESDYAERALGDLNPGLVKQIPLSNTMIMIVLGLAGLIFGAHILVDGAIIIARTLGISEAVIGLTIVANATAQIDNMTRHLGLKDVVTSLQNTIEQQQVHIGTLEQEGQALQQTQSAMIKQRQEQDGEVKISLAKMATAQVSTMYRQVKHITSA